MNSSPMVDFFVFSDWETYANDVQECDFLVTLTFVSKEKIFFPNSVFLAHAPNLGTLHMSTSLTYFCVRHFHSRNNGSESI